MATNASIKINGVNPGVANTHLTLGSTVSLSNDNAGGELTYEWTIVSQPAGTPGVVFVDSGSIVSTTPAPEFDIDKEGSYLIRLIVNQGLPDEASATTICAVRELETGNRIPAAQETTECDSDEGWALDAVNDILQRVTRLTDSGIFVAKADTDLNTGTVVHMTGMVKIAAGLPGERYVPTVGIAHANDLTEVDGPLGIMMGDIGNNGLAVLADDLCRVMVVGAIPEFTLGIGGTAGDPVFVNDAGSMSRAAGTYVRQVGDIAQVLGGGVYDIAISAGSNSIPRGNAGPPGDLSGLYPNPTVAKINGTTITTPGGSLAIGKVLRVTGVSAADWGAVDLADSDAVTGTLPIARGGTGNSLTTLTIGSLLYADTAARFTTLAPAGVMGSVLTSNGGGVAPSWVSVLPVYNGGTGNSLAFTSKGVIFANSTTEMSSTAAGTAGQPLVSGGGVSNPAFGAMTLSDANTSGTLSYARGGTGQNSLLTQGGVIWASTTTAMGSTALGTAGYLLKSNGTSAPSWLQTVPVTNGGTGQTTFTDRGVLYGNGTSALSVTAAPATAGLLTAAGLSATPSWLAAGSVGETLSIRSAGGLYNELFWKTVGTTTSTVASYTTTSGSYSEITNVTCSLVPGVVVVTVQAPDTGAVFSNYIQTATNGNYTTVGIRFNVVFPDASNVERTYQFRSATSHNTNQITGSISFPNFTFFTSQTGAHTVYISANVTSGNTFTVQNLALRVAQG